MVRSRKPPSQTWRTFLENHANQLVSIDFFTVPTIRFQVLYVFLVLAHDRRRILHFNVTAHPTAEWTAQQLREAFPFDQLPRYLLRDRDAIFGNDFREQVRDMGISEVLSAASLCRASDWIHSARVPRSRDRVPRRLVATNAQFVFRLLSPIENTSLIGEGLTGATSDSAAGNGVRRGGATGRWPASPLRTTGCLKKLRFHHAYALLSLGPWNLCSNCTPLQKRASANFVRRIGAEPQTA